jgi:hypothetical protein
MKVTFRLSFSEENTDVQRNFFQTIHSLDPALDEMNLSS